MSLNLLRSIALLLELYGGFLDRFEFLVAHPILALDTKHP
jgi:hypothetical protein